nr:NADH-plastoquinone oxidoreductase subunit 7 [Juncus alatus]YP_010291001.1 NADH-plastoquinone oxidoreductase subunit 7 [Juncus alatus]ULQ66582.1 NADH-plastoquinone oxidoreductase subunit 7 [Juncus alatus]ULQ66591.1 NADH-plastoquinone oxidoreductase subunit 7 [Juncus alatus]
MNTNGIFMSNSNLFFPYFCKDRNPKLDSIFTTINF